MIINIIFYMLLIVMLLSTLSSVLSFFYFNFGMFKWYYHDILGWDKDDPVRRLS